MSEQLSDAEKARIRSDSRIRRLRLRANEIHQQMKPLTGYTWWKKLLRYHEFPLQWSLWDDDDFIRAHSILDRVATNPLLGALLDGDG